MLHNGIIKLTDNFNVADEEVKSFVMNNWMSHQKFL